MIQLKNVSKRFGDKTIISDVNLHVKKGEMIGLTGPSGCGKSTLLNLIGTLDKKYEGEIMIDGEVLTKSSRQSQRIRKNKLGYLFQNFALLDDATVEANLKMVSNNKKRMIDVLSELGIQDKLKEKIYTLSGGEQQRVAIARLMLKEPEIILADEPTGSLDKYNEILVFDILKKLKETGKTILVVTHEEEVLHYFDRIVEIQDFR